MKVVILGFRYSGKSVIGKLIADLNNLKFIDLDEEIEKTTNNNIGDIVNKQNGWELFRKIELAVFNKIITQDNIIISCGGGFGVNNQFCNEKQKTFGQIEKEILQNLDAIKILFEINEDCLANRIKVGEDRPNFNKNNDILTENLSLYRERKILYNNLDYDIKIDTSYDNFSQAIFNKELFCVIGSPVWHSLSPNIHNTFNKLLNSNNNDNNNFVYTKMEVKPESFYKIMDVLKIFSIQGASITSPFKEQIIKYLSHIDNESELIGAVNTILLNKKNGKFEGFNTDWFGVVEAIKKYTDITNKKIAIFGSGGGAKSAVIGLLKYTKNISMFNRTPEKNTKFAKKNNINSYNINKFNGKDFDIIINATTVGLNSNQSILKKTQICDNHIIFDMVYHPLKTTLLKNAISRDAKIIYGTDMLINQAIKQFELYTMTKLDNKIIEQVNNNILQMEHSKCIVVQGKTIKEFLKNLKFAQQKSDFIELRVDYIKNLSRNHIDIIADKLFVDSIFTCRNLKNGGMFLGSQQEQIELITYAMSLNKFKYFDIDFSLKEIFKSVLLDTKRNFKCIISYHNFKKQLSYIKATKMIDEMFKYNADIAKIAYTINDIYSIETMIKILKTYKTENKNIIFAPMSDKKIIRIIAKELGSWTNFFSLNKKCETAKGQLTIENYDKISQILD